MVSASWKTDALIDKLLAKLKTKQEVYEIYMIFTRTDDVDQLEDIGERINKIELAYGRLAGDGKAQKQNQIIDLNQLKSLEREFAERAEEIAGQGRIFKGHSLLFISYLWEAFNKETYSFYVGAIFGDEEMSLKFICRLAGQWTGTSGKGWSYNKKYYSKWTTDEQIYKRIEAYDKEAMKHDFDHEELVRIASFYLNYGKTNNLEFATINEAEELLREWKII